MPLTNFLRAYTTEYNIKYHVISHQFPRDTYIIYCVPHQDRPNSVQPDSSYGWHRSCSIPLRPTVFEKKFERKVWRDITGKKNESLMETRISILVCICLQTMLRKISTATIELWGHLKELVNRDPVTTESDLVSRVYVACAFVAAATLAGSHFTASACITWYARGMHF